MTMSCEQFGELLMDLSYGELPPAEEARLLTHADLCESCRKELDGVRITRRMAAALPAMDPPASLDVAVQKIAESIREPEPPLPTIVKSADGPGFFEQLHRLFFKPAMATAGLAAAIAGTLFLLHRNEAPSMLDRRSDGAPFQGAARLAETSDSAAVPAPAATEGLPSTAAAAPPAPMASQSAPAGASESNSRARSAPSDSLEREAAPARTAAKPLPTGSSSGAANGAGRDYDILGDSGVPAEKKKEAAMPFATAPETGASDDLSEARAEEAAAPAARKAPSTAVSDVASAPKSAPISRSASFTSGLEAYNRGNCTAATADFQRVLSNSSSPAAEIPAANHYIARCEARMGRCGKAILYYDTVISRHPGYADRPAALYEAADCQRKLGNTARARAYLEELRTFPAWAARANSRLEELNGAKAKEAL